jgi:transformation/transcription domain-associated protein
MLLLTVPHLSLPPQVDLGVKTKTQLVAERQVLVTLISAIIGAAADEQLADAAGPFARGICRHFAMLFAAGAQVGCTACACMRCVCDVALEPPGHVTFAARLLMALQCMSPSDDQTTC